MKGQVTSLVAAAIFFSALTVLFLFALLKISSLPHWAQIAPLSQPQGAPSRWIHVFRSGGVFIAIDAGTPSPYIAAMMGNINGTWIATFYLWPGGYNCTYNSSFLLNGEPISTTNPLKIGPDPYTGLWCPPPWSAAKGCATGVLSSMGRILVVRCIS